MKKNHSVIPITHTSTATGKYRVGKKSKNGDLVGEMSDWVPNHIGREGRNDVDMSGINSNTVHRAYLGDFEHRYTDTRTITVYKYTDTGTQVKLTDEAGTYGRWSSFSNGDVLLLSNGMAVRIYNTWNQADTYAYVEYDNGIDLSQYTNNQVIASGVTFDVVCGSGTAKKANGAGISTISSENTTVLSTSTDITQNPAIFNRLTSILFASVGSEQQAYGVLLRSSNGSAPLSLVKFPAPVTLYEGEQLYVEYDYTFTTTIFEPVHYDWEDIGGNPLNFYCDEVTSDGTTLTLKTSGDLEFLIPDGGEVRIKASTSTVHNIVSITPVNTTHAIVIVDTPTDWEVSDILDIAGTTHSEYDDNDQTILTKVDDYTFHISGSFFQTATTGTAKFNVTDSMHDGVYTINNMPDTRTIEILTSDNFKNGTCYVEETGGVTVQHIEVNGDGNSTYNSAGYWNTFLADYASTSDTEVATIDPLTKKRVGSGSNQFRFSTPSGFTSMSSGDVSLSSSSSPHIYTGISSNSITIGALVARDIKQIAITAANTTDGMPILITFDKVVPKVQDYKMSLTVKRRIDFEYAKEYPDYPFTGQ